MAAIDDLTDAVEAAKTVDASVVVLLEGIIGRLDQAGSDSVKLNALKDDLVAATDALAAAAAAVPPAPTVP